MASRKTSYHTLLQGSNVDVPTHTATSEASYLLITANERKELRVWVVSSDKMFIQYLNKSSANCLKS
jgi:hypothetical protein